MNGWKHCTRGLLGQNGRKPCSPFPHHSFVHASYSLLVWAGCITLIVVPPIISLSTGRLRSLPHDVHF
jgi:hypothetical protein